MRQDESEKSYITDLTDFAVFSGVRSVLSRKKSLFYPQKGPSGGDKRREGSESIGKRRKHRGRRANCKKFFATVNKKGRTYYKFVTK